MIGSAFSARILRLVISLLPIPNTCMITKYLYVTYCSYEYTRMNRLIYVRANVQSTIVEEGSKLQHTMKQKDGKESTITREIVDGSYVMVCSHSVHASSQEDCFFCFKVNSASCPS